MVELSGLSAGFQSYLQLDASKYRGMWVALLQGKVIASGYDPKTVVGQAKLEAKNKPFMLTKVTASELEVL